MIKKINENFLITFIYPECEIYIKSFIDSLNKQKYKNFKVIFFYDKINIKKNIFNKLNIPSAFYKLKGSISNIRQKALKKILAIKPKKICFADVDDIMDENRAKVIFKLLDKNDIVFNDLDLCFKNKKIKNYLSKFFKNYQKVNYLDILDSNFIGFTNSAINFNLLNKNKKNILTSKKIIVYDWFFWSNLLIKNKALFTNKTKTKYYISENSKNQIPPRTDKLSIQKLMEVKNNHYGLMSSRKKIYKIKKILYAKSMNSIINHKNFLLIKNKLEFKLDFWWSINLKL